MTSWCVDHVSRSVWFSTLSTEFMESGRCSFLRTSLKSMTMSLVLEVTVTAPLDQMIYNGDHKVMFLKQKAILLLWHQPFSPHCVSIYPITSSSSVL